MYSCPKSRNIEIRTANTVTRTAASKSINMKSEPNMRKEDTAPTNRIVIAINLFCSKGSSRLFFNVPKTSPVSVYSKYSLNAINTNVLTTTDSIAPVSVRKTLSINIPIILTTGRLNPNPNTPQLFIDFFILFKSIIAL